MRSCCPLSSQAAPLVQRGVPHRGEGIGSFSCAPSFRYPPQNIHAPYKEGGRYFFDPPKKYPKKCPLVSEAADPSAQGPYSGSLGISAQRWARLSARCPSGGAATKILPVPPLPAPPQSTIAARFLRRAGFEMAGCVEMGQVRQRRQPSLLHSSLLLIYFGGPWSRLPGLDLKKPGRKAGL